MGRRTEAVQADTPTIACHFQGTPADQTGAEQRRRGDRIVKAIGKRVGRVSHRMSSEAAVAAVSSEDRPIAEILAMSRTIGADTACMAKPGNTDALTTPGRHDPLPKLFHHSNDRHGPCRRPATPLG
jgi:hypothetical protein